MNKFQTALTRWKEAYTILVRSGELQRRLSICAVCPKRNVILGAGWCGECHCNLQLKAHTPDAYCPLKKW